MKIIVAVDENWGIGYRNRLLVSIPADLCFFKEKTAGNIIVMGRKTLESFPGHRPLKSRTNVVITRDTSYKIEDAIVINDMKELEKIVTGENSDRTYVIGGGSVYRQLEPYCDTAYVTKISKKFKADTYFPNLDDKDEWEQIHESDKQSYKDIEYVYTEYRRKRL